MDNCQIYMAQTDCTDIWINSFILRLFNNTVSTSRYYSFEWPWMIRGFRRKTLWPISLHQISILESVFVCTVFTLTHWLTLQNVLWRFHVFRWDLGFTLSKYEDDCVIECSIVYSGRYWQQQ
jgi:hypothetical protein